MNRVQTVRACLPLMAAAALLVGCSDKEDTPKPVGESQAPLPAAPPWATPLMQKTLSSFQTSTACLGAFDAVTLRHTGASPGVEVEGWAWLKSEKQPPSHLLFADQGGAVVGAAETSLDRPDVPKAIGEITTIKVGWRGEIAATTGQIKGFAVLPDGSLCQIGIKSIGT